MAAEVTALEVLEGLPNPGIKEIWVTLASTTDATDYVNITLTDYGISATGLLAVQGWTHTTDGSVVVANTPTTLVTAGVLKITVGAGTDDDYRVFKISGKSTVGDFS